jgi:hypothetical protein
VFAQDAHGRHVALKLCKASSIECTVYRILARDHSLLDAENFPGVLPPVGFIPWRYDHCIVVLPRCVHAFCWLGLADYQRWQPPLVDPGHVTISQVLDFIRCMLRVCCSCQGRYVTDLA